MRNQLVPAGPENKRVLRSLLARPEGTWTPRQRLLYSEIVRRETAARSFDVEVRDRMEVNLEKKQAASDWLGLLVRWVLPHEETRGERERSRRKAKREAVTGLDGRRAVTFSVLYDCIVCGHEIPKIAASRQRWKRTDAAYCSNACRQCAYRRRRGGEGSRNLSLSQDSSPSEPGKTLPF